MQVTIEQALAALAGISSIVALGGQAYDAYRANQWGKLLEIAGAVTFELACAGGMTNQDKRREAERRLYDLAPAAARRLFTEAQFAQAVEFAWEMIAKPKLQARQPATRRLGA